MTEKTLTVIHPRVVTDTGGGPDKTILNSPKYLRKHGIRSFAVYLYPPGDPGFKIIKTRAQEAECELIGLQDIGLFDIGIIFKLLKICKERKVDIWHGHDYKTNVLGLILRLFHSMQLISTAHGWGVKGPRTPFYYKLDKWSLRFYQRIVCVSQSVYDISLLSGVNKDKLVLVENAIDEKRFSASKNRLERKKGGEVFTIGSIGRLSAEKCFAGLVSVVDEIIGDGYNVELVLAGEGPERNAIESRIAQCNHPEQFKLLGFIQDTFGLLDGLSMFVLFSSSEGLPNVVLEALAMEVPVIATKVGGIPNIITDNKTGLLCEPNDKTQLKERIVALIDNPEKGRKLAINGRRLIEQKYSFEKRMEKMAIIYRNMQKKGNCK